MIDELSLKKEIGILKVIDFDLGANESKLTHFEISIDSVFKMKLADFLNIPINIYLP